MSTTQTGFAEINGTGLYYEVAGAGQPLLMVHAGIADNSMWDAQFEYFAQQYKVIRYDMRGFGQSPPLGADYQRHEDMRALLDFLGVEHTVVMGCSMGGSACMNFVLEYPQRADALIMVGSAPGGFFYDDWSPSPLDEAMDAAFEQGDMAQVNEIAMQIFVDGTGRKAEAVDPLFRKKVYDMNEVALKNGDLMGKDLPLSPAAAERLDTLDLPVLIVVGALDEDYSQRAANFMENTIAGAAKIVMPGTAHLPNMEFPQEFNAHVQAFLDKNSLNMP